MCGVVGFVDVKLSDPLGTLRQMQCAIEHRGPDGGGHFIDAQAALAMARLAIIDPARGNQPKTAGDGMLQLVMNGEIYNYRALRAELEGSGIEFESASDTEVAVRAIEAWGPEAFHRFDGMFATAAWDRRTRTLTLARDRFGEKPLFLWTLRGGLAFASEPKALACVAPLPAMDPDALDEYLQFGYVSAPRTIWSGIRKLTPGTIATFTNGLLAERPFFELRSEIEPAAGGNAIDALEERLLRAVKSRLVADVEVGSLLSGGVDSSLVTWAARQLRPSLRTFTVGFGVPERDETAAAAAVARHLGTDHEEMTVSAADALSVLPSLTSIFDEPFADSSAIPTLLLSRFVRQRVKVALSGDGGDELFSGYARYREVQRLMVARRWMPSSVRRLCARWALRPSGLLSRVGNIATLLGSSDAETYVNRSSILTPTVVNALTLRSTPDHVLRRARVTFDRFPGRGPLVHDFLSYLPDDLLTKVDRTSMSVGLELRVPFLSPELVTWALTLPTDRLGPPGAKSLPRQLVRRHLPPAIAEKPKQGFSVPLADWLRGPLRSELDAHLSDQVVKAQGLFQPSVIAMLRERLDRGRNGAVGPLWALLVFQLWWTRQGAGSQVLLQDHG